MRNFLFAFYLFALINFVGIALSLLCVYMVYLLIEELLFMMTFKTWRLPDWVSFPLTFSLNWVFEIILQCCRGLVGKPLK